MITSKKIRNIHHKSILVFTVTIVMVLITISTVSATLITINTNDLTAIDWASQPQFHSDPPNDINTSCGGGDARDEIVETYVASGPPGAKPTNIYFLVKFSEPNTGLGTLQYHVVSAYLDCTPTGQDNADANVIYRGNADQVVIGNGALPQPGAFFSDDTGTDGQRVINDTSNYTSEWQAAFSEMAGFTQPGPLNCTPDNIARIRISTNLIDQNLNFLCTYDDTGWRDFNTPTAVEMESIKATNQNEKPLLFISITALLAAVVAGAIGFSYYRKIKT